VTTKLFCDHSPNLLALFSAGEVPLDGVEMTPHNRPDDIPPLREAYAGIPFIFHASNVGRTPTSLASLEHYLQVCPETPWISLHLSLVPTWALFFAFRFDIGLPLPDPFRLEARLIRRLSRMMPRFDRPVILENMPANRHLDNAFESDPAMIRRVLDAVNVDMLLDLAHARVAAAFHQMPVRDFLTQLPLERVRQIHVSGVRQVDGVVQDAHETLSLEDYDLFQWVIERTRPEVVTLEYFRDDRPALREMLVRLNGYLDVLSSNE
jgi:hypothetical protein